MSMLSINSLARFALPRRAQRPSLAEWTACLPAVAAQDARWQAAADGQLRAEADALRKRIANGSPPRASDLLVPLLALFKQAARRTLNLTPYDVQLLAGLAMLNGGIAEMATGEGKTLATAIPAVHQGLTGRGVHLATVNAYLAERDYHQLKPLYQFLGLSVGLVREDDPPDQKRQAYQCDVTYATGTQLGFDFLRDQLAARSPRRLGQATLDALRAPAENAGAENAGAPARLQRNSAAVIIDEIDSVLIDEANTPLVISLPTGPRTPATALYARAAQVAADLVPEADYHLSRQGTIELTPRGEQRIHAHTATAFPPRIPADRSAHPPHSLHSPKFPEPARQSGPAPQGGDALDWGRAEASALRRPWRTYVLNALRARHVLRPDVDYVVRDGQVQIVDQNTGRIHPERTWRNGLHQAVEQAVGVALTAEREPAARISRQQYFQLYPFLCGTTGTARGHEREWHRFYRLPVYRIPLRKPCRRQWEPARCFASQDAKLAYLVRRVQQLTAAGRPVLVGTPTIADSLRVAAELRQRGVAYQLLNGIQDRQESALIAQAGNPGQLTIATNMAGRGTDIRLPAESVAAGGLHVIGLEHHFARRIDRQLAGRAARQGEPGSVEFLVTEDDQLPRRLAARLRVTAAPAGVTAARFDRLIRRLQRDCEEAGYRQRQQLAAQELWLAEARQQLLAGRR